MSKAQLKEYSRPWLDRIKEIISGAPKDRQALIEILRDSENRNLLDPDVLIMIEGALHVSDMRVNEIMIPRVQMMFVKYDARPEDIIKTVVESGHSRFPVIDHDALVEALAHKQIAGAGLDVFWDEPADPDDPLFQYNVIATPHTAGVTDLSYNDIARGLAANVNRIRAGQPPINCTNLAEVQAIRR